MGWLGARNPPAVWLEEEKKKSEGEGERGRDGGAEREDERERGKERERERERERKRKAMQSDLCFRTILSNRVATVPFEFTNSVKFSPLISLAIFKSCIATCG